ncbi:plasminogen activator inhibitor 2 type A-like isoform X2 [Drosophila biarmipes]|uniref:plasminogen activator inhibitor 2 type A-like isoform X2 n=1 Tax=Drosophila biarmipes TaxID=125945 RepID=UPI001CDB3BC3|nr:plasminogen activator inhibitor 2 type A-like isoform X2 [Drosophila biarmipes]
MKYKVLYFLASYLAVVQNELLDEGKIHRYVVSRHHGPKGSLICHPPLMFALQTLYQLSEGETRESLTGRWQWPPEEGISGEWPKVQGFRTLLVTPIDITDSAREAVRNVSDLEVMDFASPGKQLFEINQRVDMFTSAMTTRLVKKRNLSKDTQMISISAGVIEGRWETPFPRKNTKHRPFSEHFCPNEAERVVMVPTMHQVGVKYPYAKLADTEMLLLPMAGNKDVKFMVLLSSVLKRTHDLKPIKFVMPTYGNLTGLLKLAKEQLVEVQLPKLRFTYSVELVPPILSDMGLKSLYSESANFGRLSSTKRLRLSSMMHTAAIDIDEGGINEVKRSYVEEKASQLRRDNGVQFFANRPFFFAILDHKQVYLTGEYVGP